MSKSRMLIISGMHRSGTSLLAQVFQAAGVDLGLNLYGAAPGNQFGLLEDREIVAFHDRLLAERKENFLLTTTDNVEEFQPDEVVEARELYAKKCKTTLWGWKDPRTALFLKSWQAIIDECIYIFVFRNPLEVVLSLLRRGTDHAVNCDPIIGLRTWEKYNRAILEFSQQNENTYLIELSGFTDDIGTSLNKISNKFALNLPRVEPEEAGYHSTELQQRMFGTDVMELFDIITPGSCSLYRQLLEHADIRSKCTRPILTKNPVNLGALTAFRKRYLNNGSNMSDYGNVFSRFLTIVSPEVSSERIEYLRQCERNGRHIHDDLEQIKSSKGWRVLLFIYRCEETVLSLMDRLLSMWKLPRLLHSVNNIASEFTHLSVPEDKVKSVFSLPSGLIVGGVNTWSIETAQHLAARGKSAVLVRYPELDTVMNVSLSPDVSVVPCDCQFTSRSSRMLPALRDHYEHLPAVFVPNYHLQPYGICALLSLYSSDAIRVLGVCHADQIYYYALLSYYEPIIHVFIAVSEEIADRLRYLLPHRKDDIVVKPCAINVPEGFSRTYSKLGQPLELMYAGRLVEYQKSVSTLIDLCECLAEKGVNFHLRIVGDGQEKNRLMSLVKSSSWNLNRYVTFTGIFQPSEIYKQWAQSDIMVSVSLFEGTSVSMMEAMAHGAVPVVTQVSGTGMIKEGDNGFCCAVRDVEAMSEVIKRLDDNRDLLPEIGMNAHETVRQQSSFQTYIPDFLSLQKETWSKESRRWPENIQPLPSDLGFLLLRTRIWVKLRMFNKKE